MQKEENKACLHQREKNRIEQNENNWDENKNWELSKIQHAR